MFKKSKTENGESRDRLQEFLDAHRIDSLNDKQQNKVAGGLSTPYNSETSSGDKTATETN